MAEHHVRVTKDISAPPETVWASVQDFSAPWHPAIATMRADYTDGNHIRVFTVHGERTEYRERLTWYSDSERCMAYTLVAGIAGAQAYNASLSVEDTPVGCRVVMAADLCADEPRAREIAKGTQMIFESGLEALAAQKHDPKPQPVQTHPDPQIATHRVGHIAFSVAQNRKSDTAVLFLHGIGGRRQNWQDQLAAVAPFATAAAMDLRGYGDSALGAEPSTIEAYCADISALAEALKPKNLILCGLSYGAWIATSYAIRHPERLSALILAGGCTGMSEAAPSVRDAFRASRETPLSHGQTPADFAPDVIQILAGPECSDIARAELLTSMSAISVATYTDALHCFTNPTEVFGFSKLNMPVLMMTGEFDRLAPPAEIQSVANRILAASPQPDVRFECLSRAGHVCNLETPDAFNEPMLELIRRVAL